MSFTQEELAELRTHFDAFDKDGSGSIDADELGMVMKEIGESVTRDALLKMIKEVDTDGSGEVEFNEFLEMVKSIREGKGGSGFATVYTKHQKLNLVEGATAGTQHAFSDEEKMSFADHINSVLQDEPMLKELLPLDIENMSLFSSVADGSLLCSLINWAVPGTIDKRAVNTPKPGQKLNIYKITENQNLVVNSAAAIGCNVVNIGAQDLIDGAPHLVLALIWQIVKIGITASINLKSNPYLVRLLEEGEELADFMKLSPEQILLRWMNYHLKEAGSSRRVHNFTSDIADSEAYTLVINQIAPKTAGVNTSPMQEADLLNRADKCLGEAEKIDCRKFVRPHDIVNKNGKLNLAFVANLFNTHPGLEPVEEGEIEGLDDLFDDENDAREERAFRMWMNSLGVDPQVTSLFDDLQDGLVLLQLLDKVQPGVVDWKKVNKTKLNKFKKLENLNYAVALSKSMGFSIVGIGGSDIYEKNKKLTLAIVWQAMRMYILNFIQSLSKDGKPVDDNTIVNWCNEKVSASGKSSHMDTFKDPSLCDSIFLIDLLAACDSNAVNYDVVFQGETSDDDKMQNAKYAISVARKIGCPVFLLWEDIVEVKPKMILTFCGAVMSVYKA